MSFNVQSQRKLEFGLNLGASGYLGDIGGAELTRRTSILDIHLKETKPSFGIYSRYKLKKQWALQGGFNYVKLEDYDANSDNPARKARNLNFRNNIFELSSRIEWSFYVNNHLRNKGYYSKKLNTYLFLGLGGFYHKPQGQITSNGVTLYEGRWFDLRPWKTEGQKTEYSKLSVSIPMGLGFYITTYTYWRFGWEINYRYTFTDYIDDISGFYANPQLLDPLAAEFASQTYQELIDQINDDYDPNSQYGSAGSINDHQYGPGANQGKGTKRGDPLHNDSFITSSFTVAYIFKSR